MRVRSYSSRERLMRCTHHWNPSAFCACQPKMRAQKLTTRTVAMQEVFCRTSERMMPQLSASIVPFVPK